MAVSMLNTKNRVWAGKRTLRRQHKVCQMPYYWWMRRLVAKPPLDLCQSSVQVKQFKQVKRILDGMLDNQRSSELYLIQHCSDEEIQEEFKQLAVPISLLS